MKKIVLLAVIAIFGVTTSNAQAKKKVTKPAAKKEVAAIKSAAKPTATTKSDAPKVDGAGMLYESETIDYGTLPHNADGKREFVFVNNGTKPLIITNAVGSCGCTVPSFPKEPIAPGARAVIGVKYATDRVGAFTKTVTVTSNAEGAASKVLTIKGTILGDETPKETPKG